KHVIRRYGHFRELKNELTYADSITRLNALAPSEDAIDESPVRTPLIAHRDVLFSYGNGTVALGNAGAFERDHVAALAADRGLAFLHRIALSAIRPGDHSELIHGLPPSGWRAGPHV